MADPRKLSIKKPAQRNPLLDNLPQSSFGAPQQSQAATPPPAQPGVTGTLPLRADRPVALSTAAVGTIDPRTLTPTEKEMLLKAGWDGVRNIPANMSQILEEARFEQTDLDTMPPPADPAKVPPLQMPQEIEEGQLSPEYRARVRKALDEADQQAALYRRMQESGASPEVATAAMGRTDYEVPVIDDTPQIAQQPVTAVNVAPENKTHCSHCGWDLKLRDEDMISANDRNTYVQSVLGGKIWRRTFDDLLGGHLHIGVRQLMPHELDACYQQAMFERVKSNAPMDAAVQDFWEQMSRYRICLQFISLKTIGNVGDQTLDTVELPDSLDEWAAGVELEPERGPTVLPMIFDTIIKEGKMSESRWRLVQATVNRFNRMNAKLEARADDPGFWKTP